MKTGAEFVESLHGLQLQLYVLGERVNEPIKHPILRPSLNALARTYDLAHDPNHAELLVRQGLDGKSINCFTSLHQNTQDLLDKVKTLRILGQETGTCFQRCVGWDALNALESTTFEMDRALGTAYHGRFMDYILYTQREDLVCNGAMTDVKGDRSLRPSQQADPDLHLHVVERRHDWIVVRGAKAHQTGAVFSHEIIVMPTLAMREEDRDYRDRIFMDGEWQFSGILAERFAGYHRQSHGGCKVGVGDVLIGAAALASEQIGVARASHVRRKLCEMVHLNEALYSCGLGCSVAGTAMASGTYLVDLLLANVCKQNVTRFPYEIARLAEDLAGGLMVTMPSERDLNHPEIGPLVEKYLRGVVEIPTADRMRILRLIENLTLGTSS